MTQPIYNRDHYKAATIEDYIAKFGSVELSKERCFNVGAGSWQHDCWTNIDLPPQSPEFAAIQSPCIFHNLAIEPNLPIRRESASLIFSSHVIEHIPKATALAFFRSAHSSLHKGGVIRIVTGPDADLDFLALCRHDRKWWYFYENSNFRKDFKFEKASLIDLWLLHLATPRSSFSETPCPLKYSSNDISQLFHKYKTEPSILRDVLCEDLVFNAKYPGDHLSWWNSSNLIEALASSGFSKPYLSGYGQSEIFFMGDMSYFDQTYPHILLYVGAIKD